MTSQNERLAGPGHHPTLSAWPSFYQSQVRVVNTTKYGFELILPGFEVSPKDLKDEVKRQRHQKSPEKVSQPTKVTAYQPKEDDDESAASFGELDKLFKKVRKFNDRTIPSFESNGASEDDSQLRKRPPQLRRRRRGYYESRSDQDSQDDQSEAGSSKTQEEHSESAGMNLRRYRTRRDARR